MWTCGIFDIGCNAGVREIRESLNFGKCFLPSLLIGIAFDGVEFEIYVYEQSIAAYNFLFANRAYSCHFVTFGLQSLWSLMNARLCLTHVAIGNGKVKSCDIPQFRQ